MANVERWTAPGILHPKWQSLFSPLIGVSRYLPVLRGYTNQKYLGQTEGSVVYSMLVTLTDKS